MSKRNRHGLKFQLLLVLKLFVACAIGAGYLVYHRNWVEGFMKESYFAPPDSLQPVIEAIKMRQPIQELYQQVPETQRSSLYDFWIATEPKLRELPRQLVSIDADRFVRRVERTLVCGSQEQRLKALEFVQLGGDTSAIPILEKAQAWAQRRRLNELANEIEKTILHLEGTQNGR